MEIKKIKREIKILQIVKGHPNIIQLLDVVKSYDNTSLIFEYMDNSRSLLSLYSSFDPLDIPYYLYKLLSALDYAHGKGIMHRDVSPHNMAISY